MASKFRPTPGTTSVELATRSANVEFPDAPDGVCGLLAGESGGQALADEPGEDEVCRVTEDFRHCDRQRDAGDRRNDDTEDCKLVRLQKREKPLHRRLEVARFGVRRGQRGLRLFVGGLGVTRLRIAVRGFRFARDLGEHHRRGIVEVLAVGAAPCRVLRAGHALISAGIWEATISWYVGQLARRN